MNISVSVYPKFDANEIYRDVIFLDWFKFQNLVGELSGHTLNYLQTYINSHSQKDHSGNLANSMQVEMVAGAGTGSVGWGIGKISDLNIQAPYWRIINNGGSSFKGDYHFVPGFFNGNKFVYNPMMPEGKSLPSGVKGIIAPMNYIEATHFNLDREINIILKSLKTLKGTGK
jgi:hypothetical protein